jgi:gamma-glutamyltranspeptidase/glutathione hydrolase
MIPGLALTLGLFNVAQAQRQPVVAEHGMVVSIHELGSLAGVEILRQGGNAVDAALATGLALAVVHPSAGNLAGGGFMLIHLADQQRQVGIDYIETAPAAAHRDMYLSADGSVMTGHGSSRVGWRASGVPGTVAGFAAAFAQYGSGRVTWAEIIEPARRLAEGHPLTPAALEILQREGTPLLSQFEESKRVFLNGDTGWRAGDIWRQPDLAATLARMQAHGPREFYEGETARRLAEAMAAHDGTITLADLRDYRPVEREPLRLLYRGHEVVGMGANSGTITLLQMLGMIEPFEVKRLGHRSAAKYHLFAEVMRRAFRDRIEYLGDPAFTPIPQRELLDRNYLAFRMQDFNPHRASPSTRLSPGLDGWESTDTTHFSVVDAAGNAVSNTYTLRTGFGSGVTIPGTGVLMNNVMDNLAAQVGVPNAHGLMQGPVNAIEPGKRPMSSQTPAMVFKEGRLLLVTGTPGGPTIINTVFQIISNVIDFGMPVTQAVEEPRIHHQLFPDELNFEPYAMTADTAALLEAKGHKVVQLRRSRYQGHAETIMIDPVTGHRLGAADPRHADATAIGY